MNEVTWAADKVETLWRASSTGAARDDSRRENRHRDKSERKRIMAIQCNLDWRFVQGEEGNPVERVKFQGVFL